MDSHTAIKSVKSVLEDALNKINELEAQLEQEESFNAVLLDKINTIEADVRAVKKGII